jgi:hypothetical protein
MLSHWLTISLQVGLLAAPTHPGSINASCMQVRYYAGTAVDARHNMELAFRGHDIRLARMEAGWAWSDMTRGGPYLHNCPDPAAIAVYDRELIKLCTDMRGEGFMPVERADRLLRKARADLELQSSP